MLRCDDKKSRHLVSQCYVWAFQSKVRKMAKIRKRYNQVPHLTQETTWESYNSTIKITNKSQEVSPFPADDHRAVMNRRESMSNTRHKNTNDRSTKEVPPSNSANLALNSDVDLDTFGKVTRKGNTT